MKSFCQIYAQWNQTRDRISEEARHLLDLGLVCDTAYDFPQAERYGDILRSVISSGGLCAPNIYPATLDPGSRDANWWKYPEDECVRLLGVAAGRHEELGLGPMNAVNTYTPGNSFVTACRRTGVRYILGFCAPTVIEDGGWEIAHYGSPLTPYFASDEDFRKPEPGNRDDAVLVSCMELRNPMVCLNHWSEGPWCPLNALAADRWLEPSADPMPFLQVAEDWLRQSEISGQPLFFHLNLQYFFADGCYEHNRRALEWLALQRDRGRLEVGGLKEWSARLTGSGGFRRQSTYWRGEMMGFHVGHRPGRYPDVVVDESLDAQAIWQSPQPLPVRRYAYDQPWHWPAFQPDGSAPASEDFSDCFVDCSEEKVGEVEKEITVNLHNGGGCRRLPVLLWSAFEDWTGPFSVRCDAENISTRIVPHPSGQGGALIVDGQVPAGDFRIHLKVKGGGRSKTRVSRTWQDLVCAETFYWRDRPYTYLVTQSPECFSVEVKVRQPAGSGKVTWEHLCGLRHSHVDIPESGLKLQFDGTRLACWHRFWGVTVDDIELLDVENVTEYLADRTSSIVNEIKPGLHVPAPGYQTFGNIRDGARWDRALARTAGDLELRAANSWFRSQRPGVGEIVVEVHPGIHLPRGSITKVLGHEFDQIRCEAGYGFAELCVDYPQGWDWGVAAWVQWRFLKLRLDGLKPGGGTYFLHLHAFDAEGRDIAQRVHFFDPAAAGEVSTTNGFPVHQANHICAVPEWILPQGVRGRWDPSALCSIQIPDACLKWSSVGVWIVPLEKMKIHHWIAEKGAPGVLSHLWVTLR